MNTNTPRLRVIDADGITYHTDDILFTRHDRRILKGVASRFPKWCVVYDVDRTVMLLSVRRSNYIDWDLVESLLDQTVCDVVFADIGSPLDSVHLPDANRGALYQSSVCVHSDEVYPFRLNNADLGVSITAVLSQRVFLGDCDISQVTVYDYASVTLYTSYVSVIELSRGAELSLYNSDVFTLFHDGGTIRTLTGSDIEDVWSQNVHSLSIANIDGESHIGRSDKAIKLA